MKAFGPMLLALLIATPMANAGWFTQDDTSTVHIGVYHTGDALSFTEHSLDVTFEFGSDHMFHSTSRPVTWTNTLTMRGPSQAEDKFGIARAAETYHHEVAEGDKLVSAEDCFALAGGDAAVKVVPTFQGNPRGGRSISWSNVGPVNVASSSGYVNSTMLASYYDQPCFGQSPLNGETLRAGDIIPLSRLIPSTRGPLASIVSTPAEASTFHGRTALWVRFDLKAARSDSNLGMLSILFADGLPGIANATEPFESHTSDGKTQQYMWSLELVGYAPGTGPALEANAHLALPNDDPNGHFAPQEKWMFDDTSFDIRYHYADAFAQAYADPTIGFKSWLDEHSDAWLLAASYMGNAATSNGMSPDGQWFLMFSDGQHLMMATVERNSVHLGPARIPLPGAGPMNDFASAQEQRIQPARLDHVLTSADMLNLAKRGGVDLASVVSLSYYGFTESNETFAGVNVADGICCNSETPSHIHSAYLDAAHGGLLSYSTSNVEYHESGLLSPGVNGGLDAPQPDKLSALSALAGPGAGAGLGVAGAAGISLILLLKFLLIPLFTRLRRASLLDNAVRARLYERVRSEPGIHQADLVDYSGVGRGATVRHLEALTRHAYVVALTDDAFARYYAAGEVPPDVARREALLRAGSHRAVYDLYAQAPTMPLRAAASALRLSAPTVHRAKKKLEKAGLLPAPPTVEAAVVRQ